MQVLHLVMAVLVSFLLLTGAVSAWLRESPASPTLLALLTGALLGPATGVLHISRWGPPFIILEEAARLTLAVGLVGTALGLPRGDPLVHWRTLAVLLGLLMPLMWLASTLIIQSILGIPLLVALLAAAAVTPTDPILARAIAEGELARRHIPTRITHILLGESGPNDGLGYPFATLAIALLPSGSSIIHWTLSDLLLAVGGAAVLGTGLGCGAGKLLRWASGRGATEPHFRYAYPLLVGLLGLAGARLAHIDGILVVFIAAVAFLMAFGGEEQQRQSEAQQAVDILFSIPVFFLAGLALPWREWLAMGWRVPALAAGILLFRRLPATLLLWPLLRRQVYSRWEAAFIGWFGPIGVSALFYAAFAVNRTGRREVWDIVSILLFSSVLAHGTTAAPLARRLGAWERANAERREQARGAYSDGTTS